HPAETPSDFARRAMAYWPQQQAEIAAITQLYLQLRYHPLPQQYEQRQLQQQVKLLRLR
ncbi:MAG: DUF4129 domain-containing protein, partial [Neisseriaceae bacterium]